jgi:AcrR family transcriptional regulator
VPGFSSPKGEQTYRRILDATLQVIADEGVRAVTHRRVAKRAGASPGLISYYFSTTEELIAGVLADVAAQETASFDRLRAQVEAVRPDRSAMVELFVEEIMRRAGDQKVLTTAMLALTLELAGQRVDRQEFEQWETSEFALCEAVVRALGGQPDMDLDVFVSSVIDGLYMSAVISSSPQQTLERAVRAGLTALFEGLRTGESTAGEVARG